MAHEGHDAHGNPFDLDAYVERLESPDRERWQQPERVVRALGVRRGQVIGEVGAGSGWFTRRLARAAGKTGRVLAVEVEPRMLVVLRDRLAAAGIQNVTPILGRPDDPALPDRSCDRILAVNVLHHIADPVAYLRLLGRKLRPGGRVVNVDFHAGELPVGPPPAHKVEHDEAVRQARRAGLRVAGEETFLPYQYLLLLAPRRPRAT